MTRTQQLADWFTIEIDQPQEPPTIPDLPPIAPGQIVLLSGPSGAGKSTALQAYRRQFQRQCIDLQAIRLGCRPIIEFFPKIQIEAALELLSRVGLAEAHCYLRPPEALSQGQRWRLRLALAIYRAGRSRTPASRPVLICDEFAALLDPVSAFVVARALHRAVASGIFRAAILASARTDLAGPLRPQLRIDCDFGRITTEKGGNDA